MFNEFEIRIISLLISFIVLIIFALFISNKFNKFIDNEKQKEKNKWYKRLFSLTQKEDDERE